MDCFPLVGLDADAPRSRAGRRTFAFRKARRAGGLHLGFTLIEVMLAITILAVKNSAGHFNTRPGPETVLEANSHLIALGTREQLQTLITLARGPG